MKKIMNELNAISIISGILAMVIIGAIWYLSANDITFKVVWNDLNRCCTSESIIAMLYKLLVNAIVLAVSTNVFSTIIRKSIDKPEKGEEIVEVIEEESY